MPRWWRTLRRDDGLTLAETVTSMAIGSILLLCVGLITVQQVRSIDQSEQRSTASIQVANAQDLTSKQLRTAAPAGAVNRFITATAETVGFYTNLGAIRGTTPADERAAFTPQEVWIWTRTTPAGKRQLCDQVRPLTRSGNNLVFPTPSLATESTRTCHVLVADLAASDGVATFTYLAATDDVNDNGLSTSSIADSTGSVTDTRTIQAVEVRLRANAGSRLRTSVLTSVVRTTLTNQTGA